MVLVTKGPHSLWVTYVPELAGHVNLWPDDSMGRISRDLRNTAEWTVHLVLGG